MSKVVTLSPRTRAFLDAATSKPLRAGDLFRDVDGDYHLVQYVNSSGAYAVPLRGKEREIAGHTVHFHGGGRTISLTSTVEHVTLATLRTALGVSSQEYRRCVKLLAGSEGTEAGMARKKVNTGPDAVGVTFDEFDTTEIAEDEGTSAAESATPDTNEAVMAKKAAAKAAKPAKSVRKCACGCKGETTSYFVPGHDSRLHSWIKKLADGRIDGDGYEVNGEGKRGNKVVPAETLKALDLKKTAKGYQAKEPHFYKHAE